MPEVVDLLSSSPPTARDRGTTKDSTTRSAFNIDSDDFKITGDLDFAIEQSAKKRRLSPPALSHVALSTSALDAVFELSSELDCLSRPRSSPRIGLEDYDDAHLDDLPRFTSSAPQPALERSIENPFVLELSSDEDDDLNSRDHVRSLSQPPGSKNTIFSERTANLLSNLQPKTANKSTGGRNLAKRVSSPSRTVPVEEDRSERFKRAAKVIVDDIVGSSQPESSKPESSKSLKARKDQDVAESSSKSTSKAVKDAQKEVEKERKKQEKEAKQREKQRAADIAEVNKSKTNKKNSTPEMMLHMPSSFEGKSLGNQVEEYMKQLGVEMAYINDQEVDLTNDTGVTLGAIIQWRRKVSAVFDDDHEIWQPLPKPRIGNEDHIIIHFKAEDLITLAVVGGPSVVDDAKTVSEQAMKANLSAHVVALRRRYPGCRPIYLIEGLSAWHKRSLTSKNRAYTAAVRSQVPTESSEPPPSSQSRRRKKSTTTANIDLSSVSEEITESLLLHLQLQHQPLQIHHTTSPTTSAAQISAFTQHLSTRPYRLAQQNTNLASASFCMTTGQIRTGSTANETWVQMLQEINRVTPSMAYGIVGAGFNNPMELVRGFRKDGREMLEDVRKSANKDGAWSDRRLGPMVSKRVYRVFMGKDPGARDGIA